MNRPLVPRGSEILPLVLMQEAMAMKELIEKTLKVLINLPLNRIGRAANLLWLSFGVERVEKSYFGDEKIVGEYGLHVQCSWRIVDNEKILADSQDMYIPSSAIDQSNFCWEDFQWDKPGNSLCDELFGSLINSVKPKITVREIAADNFGGLSICLENGYTLEVFPNSSSDEESWRLLGEAGEEHFVVFGCMAEFQ